MNFMDNGDSLLAIFVVLSSGDFSKIGYLDINMNIHLYHFS